MKLRKIAAGLFAVLGSVLLVGSVAACLWGADQPSAPAAQPQEANRCARELLDALDAGDFVRAQDCLYGQPDLGLDREPDSQAGKTLWQAYRDSVTVNSDGTCYGSGTDICLDVEVTALDISAALGQLDGTAAEILKQTLESAQNPAELLNEDGTIPETLRQQALSQALTRVIREGKSLTRRTTLKLVNQDGRWQVVPDGTLLEILSGGLK